ncbi:MAG: hypothetical protein ACI4LE_02875 [Faecalibacterium sp.]
MNEMIQRKKETSDETIFLPSGRSAAADVLYRIRSCFPCFFRGSSSFADRGNSRCDLFMKNPTVDKAIEVFNDDFQSLAGEGKTFLSL